MVYALSLYSSIVVQFTDTYNCSRKTYFWFLQVVLIIEMITMYPMSLLMSKYLKVGMQFCIFLTILGSVIKLLMPFNITALFVGQSLISCSVFFAWITISEIGDIIFTERGNQFFLGAAFYLPLLLNIVILMLPPYIAKGLGDDDELILVTHRLGVVLSLCCVPILFVSNTFKSEKLKKRERKGEQEKSPLKSPGDLNDTTGTEESFNQADYEIEDLKYAKMTSFYNEVIYCKKYYIMSSQYAIAFIPIIMVQSVGSYYLKEINYSEVESAILCSYVLAIGFVVALLCNISEKIVIMNKICIISFGIGSIFAGFSAIFHKYHVF